ncbi:hypothetical protein [Streptomyces arboris]
MPTPDGSRVDINGGFRSQGYGLPGRHSLTGYHWSQSTETAGRTSCAA